MPKRLSYTMESVEHALSIHSERGLIRAWNRIPDAPRWSIQTTSGEVFELRSLREAYVFVYALGSANQAFQTDELRG